MPLLAAALPLCLRGCQAGARHDTAPHPVEFQIAAVKGQPKPVRRLLAPPAACSGWAGGSAAGAEEGGERRGCGGTRGRKEGEWESCGCELQLRCIAVQYIERNFAKLAINGDLT